MNFIQLVKNVLEEKEKSLDSLFDNVISKNSFYKYKKRFPNLETLYKIANYLEVSIDYLFELKDINSFKPYSINNNNFYTNLMLLINSKNISGRKFCLDLHFSRDNLKRWKTGTHPSIQTLLDITNYFNCTFDDLLL